MKGIAKGKRLLAAGLILAMTGCATVQTTESGAVGVERKQFISNLVSEAELNQAAAQNYAQVLSQARQQKALDTDAAQTRRVKTIAQRLIEQVGVFRADARSWSWEVHVINQDEVNAWCMPGGKMAVYSGLIKRIQPTDAELAAVIGHEMAHALREHSREQVSQKMATSFGLTVLSALTGVQAVNDLGGTLSEVMFELPNSRTHESEADLIGVELAARAGYDPRAAVTLWQKMGALEQGRSQPEFLSTHPASSTRIADLQAISERVMPLYQQAAKP
ncbi:M48 family metallopeptidase [Alcaligenes phenolicus]|uniref:M48 family metallopeptidase n=1 Tax=Alcaligenes phenolicus TaxID=232846 RepID=UPI000E93F5BE|nr:M48 family metallopeptidase [Alcaligenes phenolicus]HBJ69487.1 peptidase M48 [Alcaligenes faecalis]